ncbi:hypothetical protein K493DRAFT_312874 [Basidiobolus meristosporus CBS 931.73]|uniref:BZIP domain-containing protein n=1 Tax=Basidiobolus meristosporus CBS 931.73 TaxID=1314790 RepID=A0A1Y1YQN6_9FUNG|nr:hypothetical protein K493DRAFT_312874 [Basidiobolus meristosporus CBS 931.73]|eukprot:ORY00348.1 hypothetical protein K493DRAFT_312874 [Basidiobolus meristosporus CBS 931.73]
MPTFSKTASLSSEMPRQVSPDYLGIRRVASRKRKTMNSSVNGSSYDQELSPLSSFSSEAESDRLHFAHAAEQLVAAASLVASLSFSTSTSASSNSSNEVSNMNDASVSPSTSAPSSPTESSLGRCTPGSLKSLTIEERRQRRLIRNREAAKECRKKKKLYVSELEEKVQRLDEENCQLRQEIQELQAKITLSILHKEKGSTHQA